VVNVPKLQHVRESTSRARTIVSVAQAIAIPLRNVLLAVEVAFPQATVVHGAMNAVRVIAAQEIDALQVAEAASV
jgi:hypothetical protein